MTDLTHEEIRDALPDVVNATMDAARRKQVEDHLRSCSECASELRVLQMVKDAPSFAPMVDAVKVSSAILPYGGIPAERPRTRIRPWQMLSAVAAVLFLAVTLMSRERAAGPNAPEQVACRDCTIAPVDTISRPLPTVKITSPQTRVDSAKQQAVTGNRTHELQVAVGLEDLSDGSLAQLASELGALDGLPSAEPENLGVADPTPVTGGGL